MIKTIDYNFDALRDEINQLRISIAKKGFAYGALFVGIQGTSSFGFVFAKEVPQDIRMSMIADMEQALKLARLTFQQ